MARILQGKHAVRCLDKVEAIWKIRVNNDQFYFPDDSTINAISIRHVAAFGQTAICRMLIFTNQKVSAAVADC